MPIEWLTFGHCAFSLADGMTGSEENLALETYGACCVRPRIIGACGFPSELPTPVQQKKPGRFYPARFNHFDFGGTS